MSDLKKTMVLQKGNLVVEVALDWEFRTFEYVMNMKTKSLLTSKHPLVKQLVNNLDSVFRGVLPAGITRIS